MIFLDTPTMIYILIGFILILTIWIMRLEYRLKSLTMGKNGKSLENLIVTLKKNIHELEHFRDESIEYLKLIEMRLKRSVQAVETIRFNPFKGTGSGGNQSFSTALINEKGDGVVISSLHSRDHVSIFSKPVKKFSSDFETTTEEKNVIRDAKDSLSKIQKLQ